MKKMTFSTIFKEVKSYVIIAIGLLLYVLGWEIFLLPNHLVGGGVTGISAILLYALGIPVSVTFFVINAILIAIAMKVIGAGFGIKNIYAIIVTTLLFQFVPQFITPDSEFVQEIAISNGKLISALFGGVLTGLGIGISFMQGGSSGGTDIIALMVAKFHNITPGKMILYMDVVIISSSLLIPNADATWGMRLATVLYGFMLITTNSSVVDMTMAGQRQSVQAFIFSKKYGEIADAITKGLGRGVTVLEGEGWYTKQENKMLIVVIHKTQTNNLRNLIKNIDKEAFISMSAVASVYGRGFQQISK